MNNTSEIKEVNVAIAKISEHNANAAIQHSNETRKELTMRVDALQNVVNDLHNQVMQLQQKYNLLLTKQFNGGSTTQE